MPYKEHFCSSVTQPRISENYHGDPGVSLGLGQRLAPAARDVFVHVAVVDEDQGIEADPVHSAACGTDHHVMRGSWTSTLGARVSPFVSREVAGTILTTIAAPHNCGL